MTGGLGGIGLEVAGWLAEAGAGAIVLKRATRAGPADDGGGRGVAEAWRGGAGGDRGRHRRGCGRCDARACGCGRSPARRRHPQRGGSGGRGADEPGLGALRGGARAEGTGGVASPPRDPRPRSRSLRPLLEARPASSAMPGRRTTRRPTPSWTSWRGTAGRSGCRARRSPGAHGRRSARPRSGGGRAGGSSDPGAEWIAPERGQARALPPGPAGRGDEHGGGGGVGGAVVAAPVPGGAGRPRGCPVRPPAPSDPRRRLAGLSAAERERELVRFVRGRAGRRAPAALGRRRRTWGSSTWAWTR